MAENAVDIVRLRLFIAKAKAQFTDNPPPVRRHDLTTFGDVRARLLAHEPSNPTERLLADWAWSCLSRTVTKAGREWGRNLWEMTAWDAAQHEADEREATPTATTGAAIQWALGQIPSFENTPPKRLQKKVEDVLGFKVARSTFFAARKRALSPK